MGGLVLAMVWICLVAALARPQRFENPVVQNKPARDLLLAVDLSGSMDTTDMKDADGRPIDRLTAVKQVLSEFLAKRTGDRVGLIFFGNSPFVQAPFTDDLEVCSQLLDEAQVRMAGPRTMLGDAIGKAVTVFEKSPLEQKVLILLTDGNDTGSLVPPVKAAELAGNKNIVIYTIAMGDPTLIGEEKFDEDTIKKIAKTTHGQYFRASDRKELEGVYVELDRLTPHQVETISHRPVTDLFYWPLAVALALIFTFNLARFIKGTVNREHRIFFPSENVMQ
jgi:Ca-activated chloride channel family protein